MSVQTVKIPDKHYVGLVKRSESDLPLAFMTPWGTDSAAKNRIKSVDEWSNRRWGNTKSLPSITIDNSPMTGFKLTSSIRTTSYGGLDKWRIQDPRGFELEITSGNLARLLSVGVVEKGEILDSCVWARVGADNVLLSVNSEDYSSAVEATRLSKSKAKWKDVKIGNSISLQNTISGVYMGKYYPIVRVNGYDTKIESLIPKVETTQPVFAILSADSTKLWLIRNPKLAEVISTEEKLPSAAELEINELVESGQLTIDAPYSASYHQYTIRGLVLTEKYSDVTFDITLEKVDDFDSVPYRWTFVDCADGFGYVARNFGTTLINLIDRTALYQNFEIVHLVEQTFPRFSNRDYQIKKTISISPQDATQILFAYAGCQTACGNKLKVRM